MIVFPTLFASLLPRGTRNCWSSICRSMQPGPHLDYGHARVCNHGYQSANEGVWFGRPVLKSKASSPSIDELKDITFSLSLWTYAPELLSVFLIHQWVDVVTFDRGNGIA